MKILDKIKKALKNSSLNISSNETHYSSYNVKIGGKTVKSKETLTINGKEVDPKSKKGKEALEKLGRKSDSTDRVLDQVDKALDKVGEALEKMADAFDELL